LCLSNLPELSSYGNYEKFENGKDTYFIEKGTWYLHHVGKGSHFTKFIRARLKIVELFSA